MTPTGGFGLVSTLDAVWSINSTAWQVISRLFIKQPITDSLMWKYIVSELGRAKDGRSSWTWHHWQDVSPAFLWWQRTFLDTNLTTFTHSSPSSVFKWVNNLSKIVEKCLDVSALIGFSGANEERSRQLLTTVSNTGKKNSFWQCNTQTYHEQFPLKMQTGRVQPWQAAIAKGLPDCQQRILMWSKGPRQGSQMLLVGRALSGCSKPKSQSSININQIII